MNVFYTVRMHETYKSMHTSKVSKLFSSIWMHTFFIIRVHRRFKYWTFFNLIGVDWVA